MLIVSMLSGATSRSRRFMAKLGAFWSVMLAPGFLPAQSTQALISGRVVDSVSGSLVRTAIIICRRTSINETFTIGARSGEFVLPLLSPGVYDIQVSAPKYQTQELRRLELAVSARLELDFRLRPLQDIWEARRYGSFLLPHSNQILRFYGPDVDTSRFSSFDTNEGKRSDLETSASYVISVSEIAKLPLSGRDVFSALMLLPGVTADTGTARGLGLSINGQRPSSSNFLLDGLELNNYLVTGPEVSIAPEAVQEYRISTNNFSAEFGRTSGFLANAVSRSASTRWHALAYSYLKNDVLNANGFNENLNGFARAPVHEIQPGLVVGGPVFMSRLFLSVSYERLRFRSARNPQVFVLPTAGFIASTDPNIAIGRLLREYHPVLMPTDQGVSDAGPVTISPTNSLDRTLALPRLDYSTSNGDQRITLRTAISRLRQPDLLYNPYPGFSSPFEQNATSYGFSWTGRIHGSLWNELRVGRSDDEYFYDRPHQEVPILEDSAKILIQGNRHTVSLPGSTSNAAFSNRGRTWEATENLVRGANGQVFKAGVGLLRRNTRGYLVPSISGQYTFFDEQELASLRQGIPGQVLLTFDGRSQGIQPVARDRTYTYQQWFSYFQHSLKASSRLALNYGFRYESFGRPLNTGANRDLLIQLGTGSSFLQRLATAQFAPMPTHGDQPLYDADHGNAAIRFGFAYQLGRNGQSQLRASYGIFYDRPFDALWQNIRANRYRIGLWNTFNQAVDFLGDPFVGVSAGQFVTSDFYDYPVLYQPHLKNPRVQEMFFGVNHRFSRNVTFEINGQGSLGRRLTTTDMVNRCGCALCACERVNPDFNEIYYRANQGKSDYFALTTLLRYQGRHWRSQLAYTWSHVIDLQSDPLAGVYLNYNFLGNANKPVYTSLAAFTREFDNQGDRGNADFDQRHNLVFYSIIEVPRIQHGWLQPLTSRWEAAALGAIRSGFPYSVYVIDNTFFFNNRADILRADAQLQRPRPVPGGKLLLDSTAFAVPAPGSLGNTARNAFRGPGLYNIDLSLSRTFSLAESGRLTVRADAFNVLNHANLNNPAHVLCQSSTNCKQLGLATYGRTEQSTGFPLLTPLAETSRQIQILLRLEF